MHAIPNHVNSNFQILHFLAGSCHTPDGAYALLCNLKEGREMALAQLRAAELRVRAKFSKAKALQSSGNEWERLEADADVAEIEDNQKFSQRNIDAAQKELDFIKQCMNKLEPHRKYANLADEDAHQASQQEEWKLELMHRAENYLACTGSVPPEHFVTMRMHPEFKEIEARIQTLANALKTGSQFQLLNDDWKTNALLIENKGE